MWLILKKNYHFNETFRRGVIILRIIRSMDTTSYACTFNRNALANCKCPFHTTLQRSIVNFIVQHHAEL